MAACSSTLPSAPPISSVPNTPPAHPAPPSSPPPWVQASRHLALGLPRDADPNDETLLDRGELVVSYDTRRNAANWVAWQLTATDLGSAKRTSSFHADPALPRGVYVVHDGDYVRSGFDRGHLCPSADRTSSPEANRATFSFVNVHPQRHELNAGPWEKLETYERELARRGHDLFVVAGGLFDPSPARIGKRARAEERVAVPRASYKIIVVLERGQGAADVSADTRSIAVIMPNQSDLPSPDYRAYLTSIDAIEQESGYDFHTAIAEDVQASFESKIDR